MTTPEKASQLFSPTIKAYLASDDGGVDFDAFRSRAEAWLASLDQDAQQLVLQKHSTRSYVDNATL
jgi:hypothetical protein